MKKCIFFIIVGIAYGEAISTIYVKSDSSDSNKVGAQSLNQEKIDILSHQNGDIGSVLRLNPNIKVEDKSKDKDSLSDITPSKIEINGAKFYQNSFMLDGLSNDSMLDPASDSKYSIVDVPGNENAMFIDLDLVESINVYDSGISAKYGNFNGGVIDVITKRPTFKHNGKISYKYTGKKFTSFHSVKSEQKENYGEDLKTLDDFKKSFLSFYYNLPINEKSAILTTYSYKNSTTPKSYFTSFKNQTQVSHNFLLKYSYFFDNDAILDITSLYTKYENELFRTYAKDSDFTNEGGGINLKANYEQNYNFGDIKTAFSLSQEKNNRKKSQKDYKGWIRLSSKNWGEEKIIGESYSYEGGFGNIDKTSYNANFNIISNLNDFSFLNTNNKIQTGFDFKYAMTDYKRKTDTYRYYKPFYNGDINCNGSSEDCVDNEQFFSERKVYKAEDIDANILNFGFFIEDKIDYKRLQIKPGIRFDYNTFLKNYDISPRLNSSFDIFGDEKSVIFGGLNRYYGKSFLGFKLREARSPYQNEYRSPYRNELNNPSIMQGDINPTVWNTSSDKGENKYIYHDLDTPYSDEILLGIKQQFKNSTILLKYIKRYSKDQFKEIEGEYKMFTRVDGQKAYFKPISVTNEGRNRFDTISLNIGNNLPYEVFGFDFFYNFSTRYNIKNEANFKDYELEDEIIDKNRILYNDKLINKNDLPTKKEPEEFKFFLALQNIKYNIFDYRANINLSGVINYTNKHDGVIRLENPQVAKDTLPNGTTRDIEVIVFKDKTFDPFITFDTKISLDFPIKKTIFNVTLEVINLFDERDKKRMEYQNYSTGRQFWLNFAYNF